jgi:hypothetical protein
LLLKSVPLLEAMVMQSNAALTAVFASVLVANAAALLGGKSFLVVINMVRANVTVNSAIRWHDGAPDSCRSRSRLAVALQISLDNFLTVAK